MAVLVHFGPGYVNKGALYLALGLIGAYIAMRRGRSAWGWVPFGILLGPLALILAVIIPSRNQRKGA